MQGECNKNSSFSWPANGFSLYAGVATKAHQRRKLDRLCRYSSRPSVSTEHMALTDLGNIRYTLKTPYRDGSTSSAGYFFKLRGHDTELTNVSLKNPKNRKSQDRFIKSLIKPTRLPLDDDPIITDSGNSLKSNGAQNHSASNHGIERGNFAYPQPYPYWA